MAAAALPIAMMVGSALLSKVMAPDPPDMPSYAPPPPTPTIPSEQELKGKEEAQAVHDEEIAKNRAIRRRNQAKARTMPNIYGLEATEVANPAATGS